MPESVTDRPSESHEYILMLTKAKTYYWDAEAVREPLQPSSFIRAQYGSYSRKADMGIYGGMTTKSQMAYYQKFRGLKTKGPQELGNQEQYHGKDILSRGGKGGIIEVGGNWLNDICPSCGRTWRRHFGVQSGKTTFMPCSSGGRNIRSVLEFPTQPFPGSHFAVFPEKLPEICIKAGTPEVGCCSKCGAPYERRIEQRSKGTWHNHKDDEISGQSKAVMPNKNYIPPQTVGWQPACKCNADKTSSLVLDPFMGSGTTLWVAKKLNRRCVGYELSEEYCALAVERNRQLSMGI